MATELFTLTGDKELLRYLRKVSEDTPETFKQALYEEASRIMDASLQIVPYDTGTLASTGHVDTPQEGDDGIYVTLGYGGAAKEYALPVHEREDLHHTPPRTDHYLSIPIEQGRSSFRRNLALRCRALLAK